MFKKVHDKVPVLKGTHGKVGLGLGLGLGSGAEVENTPVPWEEHPKIVEIVRHVPVIQKVEVIKPVEIIKYVNVPCNYIGKNSPIELFLTEFSLHR